MSKLLIYLDRFRCTVCRLSEQLPRCSERFYTIRFLFEKRSDLFKEVDKLAMSISPAIFGHEDVKKALLLQRGRCALVSRAALCARTRRGESLQRRRLQQLPQRWRRRWPWRHRRWPWRHRHRRCRDGSARRRDAAHGSARRAATAAADRTAARTAESLFRVCSKAGFAYGLRLSTYYIAATM